MVLSTKTFRWLQAYTEVILRARREEMAMQGMAAGLRGPAETYQEVDASDPSALSALAAMGFPIEMPRD